MKQTKKQEALKITKKFINFYSRIPEKKWCIGELDNNQGQQCALGHIIYNDNMAPYETALRRLLSVVGARIVMVNDNIEDKYTKFGDTPKKRIVGVLNKVYDKINTSKRKLPKVESYSGF
jgi:hypothetical protein